MEIAEGAPAVETTVNTEIPVSAPVTEAPAAPATPPAPAAGAEPAQSDKRSRHDIIRDAMQAEAKKPTNRGKHAAYQPRADGKFAPGAPQIPAQPAAVAAPEIPLPKSLKREYEPHWNQTPAELRAALVQREADYEKGAAGWKAQTEQANAVLEQFKPYEWILRNEGATPQTAIAPLLQTAAILRTGTPAQKAQSVAQVMQQFGIPIEHIQAMLQQGQGQPQPAALDPQFSHLAREVQNLKSHFQSQEQQQTQRALSVIEQFAQDPANPHFAALQENMLALLQTPHLLGNVQNMSERERLKAAYDAALRLDPALSQQVIAQQQSAAQQQARTQAQAAVNTAKTAAVQVHGAPGAAPIASVNPNDRRAVIANALRSAQT